MSPFWSKTSTETLLPGMTLVLVSGLILLCVLSAVLAHEGVARYLVLSAWVLIGWSSLVLLGASLAFWWHDQPLHVWGVTARIGGLLFIAMLLCPLIARQYQRSLHTTREPD